MPRTTDTNDYVKCKDCKWLEPSGKCRVQVVYIKSPDYSCKWGESRSIDKIFEDNMDEIRQR